MPIEMNTGGIESEGESGSRQSSPEAKKEEAKNGEGEGKGRSASLDISAILWLILFVLGGGLLALYYGGIGYFPEVSWQDALTYLALMTIIGGCLLVAFSLLLLVPGAIWSEYLIFDEQLSDVLMMSARAWEPCVWSVTKKILLPFTLFMAFCHFLLYEERSRWFVALGAAASLVAVSGLLGRDLREGLEVAARKKAEVAARKKAGGQPSPAGAVPDTRAIKKHRVYITASHALLFLAFITRATTRYDFWPSVLWISALLPLATFAFLLIQSHLGVAPE